MANEHSGHRDRLRERYLSEGLDGFPPHNVLELLLFYSVPRQDQPDWLEDVFYHSDKRNGVAGTGNRNG